MEDTKPEENQVTDFDKRLEEFMKNLPEPDDIINDTTRNTGKAPQEGVKPETGV